MAKIKVDFLGPIGIDSMEFDVLDLAELRNELQKIPDLAEWLELSAVSLNETVIETLDHPLKDGDRIALLPPVCGG